MSAMSAISAISAISVISAISTIYAKFCLVRVEKLYIGHFILIDCDILYIFY